MNQEADPADGGSSAVSSRSSSDRELRERTASEILSLTRGDPFDDVNRQAEAHRAQHGSDCGLHPAGPLVMRLASTLVRAAAATTILDLGTGYGYSALWLASAAGPTADVIAIDRFQEHIEAAKGFAVEHGLGDRISFLAGEVSDVLSTLRGPVDFIHDDAWFGSAPPYLEAAIALLRVGGTLSMPNWFLLEDAVTGSPRRDWTAFAGESWADDVQDYARTLAADPRLSVTWTVTPPLGIAVRVR